MGRVLIAEDDENIRSVMEDVLQGAGHVVVGAVDGAEALKIFQDQAFDVALLDVMMPKLDGYHLAAQLQGLPNPPKVVIVTSRSYDRDEKALQSVGASAFLAKPFSNRDLLEVVARLIEEKKEESSHGSP